MKHSENYRTFLRQIESADSQKLKTLEKRVAQFYEFNLINAKQLQALDVRIMERTGTGSP